MTIDGGTICSIIQSFPVLLILAQNSRKCLHTPFNYKPPHPTYSPEYYEAYDALIQTLLHDNSCHDYQYGVPSYGHGYKKCYNHYPVYNYPADSHYPVYGQGHASQDFGFQYPSFEGHYLIKNGFNKTSYAYNRNYAPNQVHNVKRKYKVVVKGSKRLQKLTSGGFFPTREERRYPSPFGFAQNFFPNPGRITNTLNKILHLERENPFSNPAYIYPFQNRPITNPNQNSYPNNVRFPDQGQAQFPNSEQPNNSGYPGNPANVPSNTGFDNNNAGFTNDPTFTDTNNPEGTLSSGQNNGPVFGSELSNIGNGGTESLQSGPGFGAGGPGNLTPGQQNGPVFGTDTTLGQHTGPVSSQDLTNSNNDDSTLSSGQHNGPAFSTESPNFGNSGIDTLVTGQQNGPTFGQGLQNGESTLVSGEHKGNAFGTEAPNFGNGGTDSLVSGQQNGPTFGHDLPNINTDGGTLVSGQQNGPTFSTEAPNFGNSGTGALVSGQPNGPVFGQDLPITGIGSISDLVSGQQNGPVFGTESNNENKGILISGKHSGPVFSPDSPETAFASRNDFNQGIFKETCSTVEGGIGRCLSIVTCAPYVTLLQQAKTNPAAVQQLRAAHCGFEGNNPKVCCPLPAPPTEPPTEIPSGKSLPTSDDFITAFPEPPVCGLSNASFSRVVGGVDAKLGDFPWMALLGYQGRRGASTRWLCGGSLISQHHVLTAAHCIHNHEEDLYVVRLGELDLAREDEGATPTDILIKSKIKHEKYNATAFTNDIGLLVLERDIDFTDLIRPICIPTRSDLRANTFVDYNPLIAGWGDTEFRGPSASHLQVLQLPVLDNSFCKNAYARYTAQVIDERVMCAGFKKGGKDACQGDSGGPLMQPDYNPVKFTTYFYQTGVVSFGRKCAEAGFPGIYTRVTYFVPWLQKHVLGLAE